MLNGNLTATSLRRNLHPVRDRYCARASKPHLKKKEKVGPGGLSTRKDGARPSIPSLPTDLPSARARFIEPMKARLAEKPSADGDWSYELKFDGIRLIAVKTGKKVSLLSRNKNDLAGRFPEIVEAIGKLPARECVIHGEVVALDAEGRS